MLQCDINSHSTYQVLKSLGFDYIGWNALHIGAHNALERDIMDHLGFAHTTWVECNPYVFPELTERLGEDKRHRAIQACLWSEDALIKPYHFYRNKKDGAGGLFKDKKMKEYINDCPMTGESTDLVTMRLDTMAETYSIDLSSISFLNLDVQGSELEVLKGAGDKLRPKLIYCEVSWDEIYENGPLLKDIDDFLLEWGYNRIGIRQDWQVHGDAVYIRK
jgi:FkbM family methyltransferase